MEGPQGRVFDILTDEVDTNRKLRGVLLMEIGKWKGRKVVLKLNNEI